jgi:hypothetical protein
MVSFDGWRGSVILDAIFFDIGDVSGEASNER